MNEGKDRIFNQINPEPWAKLVSLNSNLENISLFKDVNKIGRQSTNDFRIPDVKASMSHCTISKDSQGKCWLEDHSTNGTYIENTIIGKGNRRELQSGDKVYLIHPSKVKPNEILGFIFSRCQDQEEESRGKRCREEEIQLEEPKNKFQNKNSKFREELGEEMKCCICLDFIYQCVTLIPCLHNFCAGCFSDWMEKSNTCPQCREEAIELKKNPLINNIIDKFLQNNPDLKRPKEEYELMDKKNKVKEDRLILKKPEIKPIIKSTSDHLMTFQNSFQSFLQMPALPTLPRFPMPRSLYDPEQPLPYPSDPVVSPFLLDPFIFPDFPGLYSLRRPQFLPPPTNRPPLTDNFDPYLMHFHPFMRNQNHNNTR